MIPVHKSGLSQEEELSLLACKKKLSAYDCYLVYPDGMEVRAYLAIFSGLRLQPVEPKWLSSVEQYNKMKLNIFFYQLFSCYTHLLTYELDSYIFDNNFEKNDAFKYDFIGAPFFKGYLRAPANAPFIKGCNSGFSLRNIRSCQEVLQNMRKYTIAWFFYKYFFSKAPKTTYHINKLLKQRFDIYLTGKIGFHFSEDHYNEDLIWSQVVPCLFKWFKVADHQNALRFSFEHNPERLLQLNEGRLPLGCHAWHKYHFWKQYIPD
jgi:hypothetical protein